MIHKYIGFQFLSDSPSVRVTSLEFYKFVNVWITYMNIKMLFCYETNIFINIIHLGNVIYNTDRGLDGSNKRYPSN